MATSHQIQTIAEQVLAFEAGMAEHAPPEILDVFNQERELLDIHGEPTTLTVGP